MSDLPLTRPEHALILITRGERDALREVASVALEVRDCAAEHGCRVSRPLLMALGAALSRLDGATEVERG